MKALTNNTEKIISMRRTKIVVCILIFLFFGSFLAYKITLPGAHDLPRQMQNGKDILKGNFDVLTKNVYSYIEPEQPFANHHWLYGVFAYLLHEAVGWKGMVLFKILFILGTFYILFITALKRANFWIVAVCSIPTILMLVGRTALRPEIFSYFFVAVTLYILADAEAHPKRKRVWWLIPLELLWVNIHLFFPVGVLLVGGILFQKLILQGKKMWHSAANKRLGMVFAGMIAVTFINPFGIRGVIYSLRVNTAESFPISSAEVNSIINVLKTDPGWGTMPAKLFLLFVMLLALSFIAVFLLRLKRRTPLFNGTVIFYLLASIGSAVLAFFVIRALPLFALIFLLALTTNLQELFVATRGMIPLLPWQRQFFRRFFALFLILLLIFLTILGQKKYMKFNEQGLGLARWSEQSASFFKENNLSGPVFNDTDIGSYLIYYLNPQEKVFADNRFGDAYSEAFFKDTYLPLIRDEEKWHEGLERYQFNTIFFYHYNAVDGARDFLFRRIYDSQWAWIYVDNYAVIFVRDIPENQAVINQFRITSDNVVDKLSYLSNSPFLGEQLAAADVFNLIGRPDVSLPLYLKIVSHWPERGKIWMVLGKTELTKYNQNDSNPYLAALYLERAVEKGWKTWETYSYLALAYLRTGQLDRVKEAVRQELKIDPHNLDGQKWLEIIAEEEVKRNNESSN